MDYPAPENKPAPAGAPEDDKVLDLDLEDLIGYAAKLDLDVDRFVDEVESSRNSRRVREDVASAEASGATGTPTFFVEGRRHIGPYDARTLERELRSGEFDLSVE